ncbi:MAG: methyltransferase domain-containing protein [Phycisphaerales bacterium]
MLGWRPKERLKGLVARLLRPAVEPHARASRERAEAVERRLARVEEVLERRLARAEELLELVAGTTVDRDKHREELAFWRWLIRTEAGRASLHAPFEEAFGGWQRERLVELGAALGLGGAGDAALDAWCAERSVVEIGAGPYPAVAAAPRWKRAVAVDPIARAYVEEGLVPAAAGHVTYIESPGERVPLPAGFADLVIIENALDHVSDPGAVLAEIRRLLGAGGLLWLLVDLSNYSDHMHPHPFNEERVRGLLAAAGFEAVSERVSDHKSHPKAYGEYRGLLRRVEGRAPGVPERVASPEEVKR